MTLQAMWVHGHCLVPEITLDEKGVPSLQIMSLGSAEGPTYQGHSGVRAWFHFPIPTPVIHNDVRARLIKGFILFRSDPDVSLARVDIWDGPNKIHDFAPQPGVSGIHDGKSGLGHLVANQTAWEVPSLPLIFWGVCLSAQVFFQSEGEITFTAAGVDFQV